MNDDCLAEKAGEARKTVTAEVLERLSLAAFLCIPAVGYLFELLGQANSIWVILTALVIATLFAIGLNGNSGGLGRIEWSFQSNKRKLFALSFLSLAFLLLYLPTSNYPLGGQDQGLYMSWSKAISRSGQLIQTDMACWGLDRQTQLELVANDFRPGEFAAGVRRTGFGDESETPCGFLNLDFPTTFPLYHSLLSKLLPGFELTFFAIFGLWLIWRISREIFTEHSVALILTIFAAGSPLLITFAKWPVSEVLQWSLYLSFIRLLLCLRHERTPLGQRIIVVLVGINLFLLMTTRLQTLAFLPLLAFGAALVFTKARKVFAGSITLGIATWIGCLALQVYSQTYLDAQIPRHFGITETFVSSKSGWWSIHVGFGAFAATLLAAVTVNFAVFVSNKLGDDKSLFLLQRVILPGFALVAGSSILIWLREGFVTPLGPNQTAVLEFWPTNTQSFSPLFHSSLFLSLLSTGVVIPLLAICSTLFSRERRSDHSTKGSLVSRGILLFISAYTCLVFSQAIPVVRYTPYFDRYLLPEVFLLFIFIIGYFVNTRLSAVCSSNLEHPLVGGNSSVSSPQGDGSAFSSICRNVGGSEVTVKRVVHIGFALILSFAIMISLSSRQMFKSELAGVSDGAAALVDGIGPGDSFILSSTRAYSWLNRPFLQLNLGKRTSLIPDPRTDLDLLEAYGANFSLNRLVSQAPIGDLALRDCSWENEEMLVEIPFERFTRGRFFAGEQEWSSETYWVRDFSC